jgi:hypothetical protein
MPESKKAKVISATYKKSFENKGTTFFTHAIEFDNGDKGDYVSKSFEQTKFVNGQTLDYTIEKNESNGYTNYRIKPVEQAFTGGFKGGKDFKPNNKGFALSYAKDITVALIAQGKVSSSAEAIAITKAFYNEYYQILES